MKLNKQAWAILIEDEQLALRLNLSLGKSTWKSGEIMKKSHYKLIEIKDRAKTFLRIFTHHFNEHGQLVPEDIKVSADLRDYLHCTIEKRMTVAKAIREINNPLYRSIATREKLIMQEMSTWKSSIHIGQQELYILVMEFDRWNNFRILPKALQEPSAFKRRDKNRLKKHLKIGSSLSKLAYKVIKKRFRYKAKHKIVEGFLCLISIPNKRGIRWERVIRVNANKVNLEELSQASLYIFPTEELAETYKELVLMFIGRDKRHCIDGLKFWPLYRDLIKKALNYEKIQNIIPSRRNLDFAQKSADKKYF